VLFFAADDVHQVSHPVPGGDACIVITLSPAAMAELAEISRLGDANPRRRTLDASAQGLRAVLLSRLAGGDATQVEAESLALALVTKTMAPLRAPRRRASRSKLALVDRVKLLLASSTAQRLSLGEIGKAVGASPVYLTQVFSELEGLPLYRYQLRLRLAQALARLPGEQDLAALAQNLGFSSHSQFTTLFRQTYGLPPADFMRATKRVDVNALLKILKAGPAWT
jgi:AraC-like DNA-binding protein